MKRFLAGLTALVLVATLAAQWPSEGRVQAAATPRGCRVENYWGVCFDTLPKLWCCSSAFLGWSEIVVGDRFPVAGNVNQGEPFGQASAIQITFPSGRTVTIPVDAGGRFAQMVTFDEEGTYGVARVEAGVERGFGNFQVAYRAELLDLPTVQSQFGRQHYRTGVTMGVMEAGEPVTLRVRFTDAQGEPVRSRTLEGNARFTTDADGVAALRYQPESEWSGYSIERLYPGLAILTYRTVTVDGAGVAHGLPGGEVTGYVREGRIYLPLREFLEKADPMDLGATPERISWNEEARAVEIGGLQVMLDTGMVLGGGDFRADVQERNEKLYMEFGSLVSLLDRLGMASRTGEFSFRLSMAQEP